MPPGQPTSLRSIACREFSVLHSANNPEVQGAGPGNYLPKASLLGPPAKAWRTEALSNAAMPNAYCLLRSSNWTSYLLPVFSLREISSVQTPLLQEALALMSPRSPSNGATMIPATSFPALYLPSSKGSLSLSRIQYGGAGLFPLAANLGIFLSSVWLSTYPPPVLGSVFLPAFGDLSLSYGVLSRY